MNGGQVGSMRRVRAHRLIRQLHLWIGAWGAIAAILFGSTGFIQNHRGILKLPQGQSTVVSEQELAVPEDARATQETMRNWLRDVQHLNVDSQRGPPGRGGESARAGESGRRGESASGESTRPGEAQRGGDAVRAAESANPGASVRPEGGGQRNRQTRRWMFAGGNARTTTQVEYSEGSDSVTVRTSVQSPVAILTRLHKGVGGGVAWILLTDSFALSMVALGISGLIMWARGRSVRRMILSIVGVATVVVAVIGGLAVV